MELRHLRYFTAVAEELNFGRAAIRLRISQPPLSQQIRQLEEELGVKLFERTKRQVRLTEQGKRILVEAQQILGQVDHFLSVTSRISEGKIGRLSVAGQAVLNEILVQTLRVFVQQYPGVHIQLHFMNTAQQVELLREEQVDIGFLHLPVEYSDLTLEPIKREPLWLALLKDMLWRGRRTSSWRALSSSRSLCFHAGAIRDCTTLSSQRAETPALVSVLFMRWITPLLR